MNVNAVILIIGIMLLIIGFFIGLSSNKKMYYTGIALLTIGTLTCMIVIGMHTISKSLISFS